MKVSKKCDNNNNAVIFMITFLLFHFVYLRHDNNNNNNCVVEAFNLPHHHHHHNMNPKSIIISSSSSSSSRVHIMQQQYHHNYHSINTIGHRISTTKESSSSLKSITSSEEFDSSSSSSSSSSSNEDTKDDDNTNTNTTLWKERLLTILSYRGVQRPIWATKDDKFDWMPTWLITLRPITQLIFTLLMYIIHLTILTQTYITFPYQLIPNERGYFQSIGLDSLAGMACLAIYQYFRLSDKKYESSETTSSSSETTTTSKFDDDQNNNNNNFPSLLSTPKLKYSPWKNIYKSKYSRFTSFIAMCCLFHAYNITGRLSIWWEDIFYVLANDWPITIAMHRSLCVLCSHLSWIVMGSTILKLIPRPQNFFNGNTWYKQNTGFGGGSSSLNLTSLSSFLSSLLRRNSNNNNDDDDDDKIENNNSNNNSTTTANTTTSTTAPPPQWVWWTIGGYFVSSWFFNIADFFNQCILPVHVLEQAQDSVVSQLINPENNDRLASLVGYIAPCITAPWWEEVLYRGYLLPTLILNMKYPWAILWSGLLFAVHHMSPTAMIPLTILGWTWSILYAKSGNLWTTILVHAMWNTRIFVGSWLGL